MVKSRKTTVKASPLPNLYSVKTTYSGATTSKRLTANNSGGRVSSDEYHEGANAYYGSNRSLGSGTGIVSKRMIFPHLTRLYYGILRYHNVAESPTSVATGVFPGTENDRRFVFVPAGYSMQNDKCLHEILMALELEGPPPLVIVTAATDGAVEETVDEESGAPGGARSKVFDKSISDLDLTEEEERELLKEKTQEILRSTVELCGETGAWLLPHRPRRANGAAEILCGVSSVAPQDTDLVTGATTNRPIDKAVILGMIGLDHQDQQDGFTELITSHMHPVGTEIEQVANISYDPNVRDNTPCPELTHILLFQRRQEMRAFRERLLALTPDVFMAFGSTTPYAKKCLFSALVDRSPVALITHTSPEIDHMSWMLRHADREMLKISVGEVDPPVKRTATYAVSSTPTTYTTLPLPPLADLSAADPELAEFLPVWPAAHNDARVVLADPRRVGGLRFQQQLLRAVNAAYYIPEARTVALEEAADLLTSIRSTSRHQNTVTERYHIAMVSATLAAVVASVMYAKIYGADPAPSFENRNPQQILLFLFTIGVPFCIVYLKRLYDKSSQLWSDMQGEAAQLESTIFEFRARPRTFGQESTPQGNQEPLDAFIRRVCEIQDRVSPFLVDSGIEELTTEEYAVALAVKEGVPDAEDDIEAPPPTESSPLLPSAPAPSLADLAVNGSTSKWKKKIQDTDVASTVISDGQQYQHEAAGMQLEERGPNDGVSLLTIKDYIECRINAGKQQKEEELATLAKRNETIELTIKLVLGSTSLLALLSKQWFIPIVLGVSAAFVASQDFRKYRARVKQGQSMIRKLDELLSWWDALGVEDKILASNEDRLVQVAESVLVAEVSFTY